MRQEIKYSTISIYYEVGDKVLYPVNSISINQSKKNPHYKIGDERLYHLDFKYSENPYERPCKVVQVDTNGTVRLKINAIMDTVKIKLVKTLKLQKKGKKLAKHALTCSQRSRERTTQPVGTRVALEEWQLSLDENASNIKD